MHYELRKNIIKVGLPILLAGVILWWMYRGFRWDEVREAFSYRMSWTWMWLSFPFGISAQVFRAMRWKQLLRPMGEHPRTHTCINAVFLSYASSLFVPRIGEVLRCGILTRYEGTNFSRSVGTVVTERIVDMLLVLVLSLVVLLVQIPVFLDFFRSTGVSVSGFLSSFTSAGYLLTAVCLLIVLCTGIYLIYRLKVFSRTRAVLNDLADGLMSIRRVRNPFLFLLYSLGIWVSYFLHFYLTFFCFGYTEHLGVMAALVAFVVGCFAVIVPTPNGAGPWHFAVKTVLVLYGVSATDGAIYALVVHTIQTLLVLGLGLYAWIALFFCSLRKVEKSEQPAI